MNDFELIFGDFLILVFVLDDDEIDSRNWPTGKRASDVKFSFTPVHSSTHGPRIQLNFETDFFFFLFWTFDICPEIDSNGKG